MCEGGGKRGGAEAPVYSRWWLLLRRPADDLRTHLSFPPPLIAVDDSDGTHYVAPNAKARPTKSLLSTRPPRDRKNLRRASGLGGRGRFMDKRAQGMHKSWCEDLTDLESSLDEAVLG